MADAIIGTSYLQVIPKLDTSGLGGNVLPGADKIGSDAGGKLGDGIKEGLSAKAVVIGNLITDAIKGAVHGAIDLGKSLASGIYDGFSANEQLVGGVEKIFDEADITGILSDAQGAYMSLNMSANDYLESINKVGATFAQTMGDQKGYDTAKKGMQAIADYASGTGANLDLLNDKYQMITRATSSYQGIADQFAGLLPQTSADFLAQAQAAGLLSGEYKSLTDVPVAEYQQAVTSMLEQGVKKMGLLGNTAAETTKTLSGSAAATKAAWQNVLTAIGTGDKSQIESATRGLMDTVFGVIDAETGRREGGFVANLTALASRAFVALGQALPGMLESALDAMPAEVSGPLRTVIGAIDKLVQAVAKVAPVVAPLVPIIASVLGAIKVVAVITSIVGAVSTFVTTAGAAIGMIGSLPGLIAVVMSVLGGPVTIIAAIVAAIVAFIATNEDARNAVVNTWTVIKDSITKAINAIKPVVTAAVRFIVSNVTGKFSSMVGTVRTIFNSVKTAITNPLNTAKTAVSNAISHIKSIINGAHLSLPHFKLPHFRINGGTLPWGIGGKGSPPSINVDWYARGGWIEDATLIGAGERGGELIWPGYAPYLDRYADAIASRMPSGAGGGNTYNITVSGVVGPDDTARAVERRLRMMQLVT